MGPAAGEGPAVFGRFEAAAPNERWVGDALHGPQVGGRKTYLFAFLDDQSRLLVGYRFGFAEDTVRLAAALQTGPGRPRCPGSVYVDNGSAFVDAWLLRACGKLGIRLIHSTPHRPQGRGKIERFFRSVREQFLVEVADTTAEDWPPPASTRSGAAGAERAVHRVGRDRLSPPGPLRDRADTAGPVGRRLATAGPARRCPPRTI